jgi:hypothetical protein
MSPLEATLQQVGQVIAANRSTENFLLGGIGALFLLGMLAVFSFTLDQRPTRLIQL